MTQTFNLYLNSLRQKGDLAYEYNPFHNYQTEKTLYLVDDTFIVPEKCVVNTKNGEILNLYKDNKWIDKRGKVIEYPFEGEDYYKKAEEGVIYAQAGSIIDLDTEQLNFDLEHPVDITVQPSYDGSVNLILNDNKNIPRLINSRFSVREKNTYEVVDRIGENDTNIYTSKYFNNDISLYLQYTTIPTISFEELISGNFPVGLYCFYITYCDSDGNESDIVGESNLIPLFIGGEGIPFSMNGGIKNELSNKGVLLKLSNLDTSYNYIKIRYVRYFADYLQNRVYEGKEIIKRFEISNYENIFISITGYEETNDFDPNILNISRFNPKNILAQAQCKNMLFFGNITKITDNYKELSDISLRIVPSILKESFEHPNNDYAGNEGYYNSTNMYYKVGYFDEEYYSFGIVYIYNNGTLSNVYPTLGCVMNDTSITPPNIYKDESEALLIRQYINSDDEGWIQDYNSGKNYSNLYLNSKGVCKVDLPESYSDNDILFVKFNIPASVSKYLKETLGINGFFFVRQKCVPNIIAQCYLMPYDEVLKGPVLETTVDGKKEYYTECFVSQEKTTTEKWPAPQLLDVGERSYVEKTVTIYNPRKITHNYDVRLRQYDSDWKPDVKCYVGICPDFLLNQPYYNQIFNSSEFKIKQISTNSGLNRQGRFWKENSSITYNKSKLPTSVTICSVTEDVPSVVIKDKTFKLKKGQAEEAVRFEYVQLDSGEYNVGSGDGSSATNATNMSRGMYSPYLAIYSDSKLETGLLYNIYRSNTINVRQEISNRLKSSEPYYAISDRQEFVYNKETNIDCYRGDCFLNTFTYRLNRNFNDASLPNNDVIVDENTWIDNYSATDSSKWNDIILSDLNAVKMGSWITFKCRSAMNYALRSEDHSYVSEEALMGSPRSFYPKSTLLERGENKMPDSYLYNDAYRATLGYKCYFALNDVNYIKDNFSNRIQYSAIAIQDSYKNNYRESLSTYYRDYSTEYGSIQKLVGFEGYLLVVLEHAIGIAVVNERILAGGGDGEPVFINTQNVLPEELTIITDTYGTQWPESVIKSEAGYVYGVDTIAKKIWRVKGQLIEILSDFKVNKFLVDNISLGEREKYPIIGLKNVKTHYNNNKKDIMFTFYDDIYKDEEKVWNLCYNELVGQFITFYSWIPSYSENIDTQYFSFDRNTSKYLTLLNKSSYSVESNTGVLLNSPNCKSNYSIDENDTKILSSIDLPELYYCVSKESLLKIPYTIFRESDRLTTLEYLSKGINAKQSGDFLYELDGQYIKSEESTINYNVSFKIEKDHWGHYKWFDIENNKLVPNLDLDIIDIEKEEGESEEDFQSRKQKDYYNKLKDRFNHFKCISLYITPYIENFDELVDIISGTTVSTAFQTKLVAFTLDEILKNPSLTNKEKTMSSLTTDFYLHGRAGIFDIKENFRPTYWYGEQHPFEFEFVVNDKIAQNKLFSNLVLISNKAEPESFHFEIEGDNYDFSLDKRNMYFRQEATKNLYLNLGSDIIFDRYYEDVAADIYTQERYARKVHKDYPDLSEGNGLERQVKSSIFPLYYEKIDTYNDIYHKYHIMTGEKGFEDFGYLSGSEIKWNRDENQFNVVTHIKNKPINLFGRLRGNSFYKEGTWNIQIPSITYSLKNELDNDWVDLSKSRQNENDEKTIEEKYKDLLDIKYNKPIPPIVINSQYIPKDLDKDSLGIEDLPNIYTGRMNYPEEPVNLEEYVLVNPGSWTARKEAKIRDKWIKIRVRYSGKNLAIIHSLITLYNV